MRTNAREIGILWEDVVLAHLQAAGLKLIVRNFHCRLGEIDLIMLDRSGRGGDGIVFAEVRYRNAHAHGDGTASVGTAKRSKLVRTAQIWLQQNSQHAARPCRFDVIGCGGTPAHPQFEWTRNAFDAFTGESG
jgi:putative endonuclease